jgi:hypothetical protein
MMMLPLLTKLLLLLLLGSAQPTLLQAATVLKQ